MNVNAKVIFIKGIHIIRIDSKGRILIPSHIRNTMGLLEGTEIAVVKDEDELKLFPLYRGMNAKIKIIAKDVPGVLSYISRIIAKYKCNIMMSNSRPVKKNLAEWSAILKASNTNRLKQLKEELLKSEHVERVKVYY